MLVNYYPAFAEILADFQFLLKKKDPDIWRLDGEQEPKEIDLSFQPVIAKRTVEKVFDTSLCTLCSRRISYKKDQFITQPIPDQPWLIIVHNSFLGPQSRYYHDPEQNKLFEKMIEATLGAAVKSFPVRELLRCHFSAEEVMNKVWLQNCSQHIINDINRFSVKGILILGQAASLIFPEKAELITHQDKVFTWMGLPCMICPGPNRLVYMRQKNYSVDEINEERFRIFNSLKLFKSEIIDAAKA